MRRPTKWHKMYAAESDQLLCSLQNFGSLAILRWFASLLNGCASHFVCCGLSEAVWSRSKMFARHPTLRRASQTTNGIVNRTPESIPQNKHTFAVCSFSKEVVYASLQTFYMASVHVQQVKIQPHTLICNSFLAVKGREQLIRGGFMHQSFVSPSPMGPKIAGDIPGLKCHILTSVSSPQCRGTFDSIAT